MSATRKEPTNETASSSTSSKKLRVMKQAAEYGMAGAGAAGLSLNMLALCISLSNPVILLITGIVGSLLCCLGGRAALQEPDEQELGVANQKDLKEIKQTLNKVDKNIQTHCQEAKNDNRFNHLPHYYHTTLFSPDLDEVEDEVLDGPDEVYMEHKREIEGVRKVSSF